MRHLERDGKIAKYVSPGGTEFWYSPKSETFCGTCYVGVGHLARPVRLSERRSSGFHLVTEFTEQVGRCCGVSRVEIRSALASQHRHFNLLRLREGQCGALGGGRKV
jgi:hypothetical protein